MANSIQIPVTSASAKVVKVPDAFKLADSLQLALNQLGDGLFSLEGTMVVGGVTRNIKDLNGEVIPGTGLQVKVRDYVGMVDGVVMSDKNKSQFEPTNYTLVTLLADKVSYIVLKPARIVGSDGIDRPNYELGVISVQDTLPGEADDILPLSKVTVPLGTTQINAGMIDNSVRKYLVKVDELGAVGPQGPAGADGADGAVGPQGPQGEAGTGGGSDIHVPGAGTGSITCFSSVAATLEIQDDLGVPMVLLTAKLVGTDGNGIWFQRWPDDTVTAYVSGGEPNYWPLPHPAPWTSQEIVDALISDPLVTASVIAPLTNSGTNMLDGNCRAFTGGFTGNSIGDRTGQTILGGSANTILAGGDFAAILSGKLNSITGSGDFAAILSGRQNIVTGSRSVVCGGSQNTAGGSASVVCGGDLNSATGGPGSVVCGGTNNSVSLERSTIAGGQGNVISDGPVAASISEPEVFAMTRGSVGLAISGGQGNAIGSGNNSTIVGGKANAIQSCDGSTVLGGENSSIRDSANYSIVGGYNAHVDAAHSYSCVLGKDVTSDNANQFKIAYAGGAKLVANTEIDGTLTAAPLAYVPSSSFTILDNMAADAVLLTANTPGAYGNTISISVVETGIATLTINDDSGTPMVLLTANTPGVVGNSVSITRADFGGGEAVRVTDGATTNDYLLGHAAPWTSDEVAAVITGDPLVTVSWMAWSLSNSGTYELDGGAHNLAGGVTSLRVARGPTTADHDLGATPYTSDSVVASLAGDSLVTASLITTGLTIETAALTGTLSGGLTPGTLDVATGAATVNGTLKVVDGTQGVGKIFTSDADGLGSWQASGGGGPYAAGTGTLSIVGSGEGNIASGQESVVSGGNTNTASGTHSTVGGGLQNTASAQLSTVGGGQGNTANGQWGTVAGGWDNTAAGFRDFVGGGFSNTAGGGGSESNVVAGGENNQATGSYSTVAGGYRNKTLSPFTCIGGGSANTIGPDARYAAIINGVRNQANAEGAVAMGNRSYANHFGATVFSDYTGATTLSEADNQFKIRYAGGAKLEADTKIGGTLTAAPLAPIEVAATFTILDNVAAPAVLLTANTVGVYGNTITISMVDAATLRVDHEGTYFDYPLGAEPWSSQSVAAAIGADLVTTSVITPDLVIDSTTLAGTLSGGSTTINEALEVSTEVVKVNVKMNIPGLLAYANNAAALAGGLVVGDLYRTGGDPDLVCVVHA